MQASGPLPYLTVVSAFMIRHRDLKGRVCLMRKDFEEQLIRPGRKGGRGLMALVLAFFH